MSKHSDFISKLEEARKTKPEYKSDTLRVYSGEHSDGIVFVGKSDVIVTSIEEAVNAARFILANYTDE
jgi:hypothetical protein